MTSEISPLVKFEILEVFVNTLTVDRKYPVLRLQTVKDLVRPHFKERRFRTSFDSQHVKASQILVKSVLEHFYHISSWLWGDMILKISPLVKLEIVGVFVNAFTSDHKYPVHDFENLPFPIQLILSKKRKNLS